eukprot:3602773-Rhodomonas_salina.1
MSSPPAYSKQCHGTPQYRARLDRLSPQVYNRDVRTGEKVPRQAVPGSHGSGTGGSPAVLMFMHARFKLYQAGAYSEFHSTFAAQTRPGPRDFNSLV